MGYVLTFLAYHMLTPQSIFSSINAMEQYQSYFQLGELGKSTGLVMMLYPAGNMVGALLMAPISDLFGRRKAMGAGAVLIAAGAIILTAAKNPSYLLGGRFMLGMGVGTGTSAAPTYATEIARESTRYPHTTSKLMTSSINQRSSRRVL
jgi:MFS family permease